MDGDLCDKAVAAINDAFEKADRGAVDVADPGVGQHQHQVSPPRCPRTTRPTCWRSATPTCRCSPQPVRWRTSPTQRRPVRPARTGYRGCSARDRGRQALRRPAVRRQPRRHLREADLGRGRRHDAAEHVRGADRRPGQDQGRQSRPDFAAFYFPGEYWYGALQFVWDAAANWPPRPVASGRRAGEAGRTTGSGKAWQAVPEHLLRARLPQCGHQGPGPGGDVRQRQGRRHPGHGVNTIIKDNPAMKDEHRHVPVARRHAGRDQPVFLGGSDLASRPRPAPGPGAVDYLNTAADPAVQRDGDRRHGRLDAGVHADDRPGEAVTAADMTPRSSPPPRTVAHTCHPGWATVESDKSINDFFADIATGRKATGRRCPRLRRAPRPGAERRRSDTVTTDRRPPGRTRRPSLREARPRPAAGDALLPYGLLLPAAAVLALVLGYPLVRLVLISLQDYGLRVAVHRRRRLAGLANYVPVLRYRELGPGSGAQHRVLRGAGGRHTAHRDGRRAAAAADSGPGCAWP